ncbi:MAG: hypothetical protein V1760_01420, partial [Candidatus Peregrinibacteria bacterium]
VVSAPGGKSATTTTAKLPAKAASETAANVVPSAFTEAIAKNQELQTYIRGLKFSHNALKMDDRLLEALGIQRKQILTVLEAIFSINPEWTAPVIAHCFPNNYDNLSSVEAFLFYKIFQGGSLDKDTMELSITDWLAEFAKRCRAFVKGEDSFFHMGDMDDMVKVFREVKAKKAMRDDNKQLMILRNLFGRHCQWPQHDFLKGMNLDRNRPVAPVKKPESAKPALAPVQPVMIPRPQAAPQPAPETEPESQEKAPSDETPPPPPMPDEEQAETAAEVDFGAAERAYNTGWYLMKSDPKKAVEYCRVAASIDPEHADALLLGALLLKKLGKIPEAKEMFARVAAMTVETMEQHYVAAAMTKNGSSAPITEQRQENWKKQIKFAKTQLSSLQQSGY